MLTAVIMMLGLSLHAAHLHAAGFGKWGDAPEYLTEWEVVYILLQTSCRAAFHWYEKVPRRRSDCQAPLSLRAGAKGGLGWAESVPVKLTI